MPWFHAEGVPRLIQPSVLTFDTLEMVGAVKLHARLSGEHFEHAAALWFKDARGQAQFTHWLVDYKVLVVAAADLKLLIILVDACPEGGGRAEIEWGGLHGAQFSRRDLGAVRGRKLVGCNHHQ